MKVLVDTNILISAALNPSGTPYAAFEKAVSYPNQEIIYTHRYFSGTLNPAFFNAKA